MSNNISARDFASSAEAEANGFTVVQWLRAFTFNEHAARIDIDRALTEAKIASWGE